MTVYQFLSFLPPATGILLVARTTGSMPGVWSGPTSGRKTWSRRDGHVIALPRKITTSVSPVGVRPRMHRLAHPSCRSPILGLVGKFFSKVGGTQEISGMLSNSLGGQEEEGPVRRRKKR
jgi:hypothetical protein